MRSLFNSFAAIAAVMLAAVMVFTACTKGDPQPEIIKVTGVSLNKITLTLEVGASETLTATVAPADADNKAVTWTSSDQSVATVTNGAVTAKKVGTATITATTTDGGKTAKCTVTVTDSEPSYPITGKAGTLDWSLAENGTLTISGTGAMPDYAAPAATTTRATPWSGDYAADRIASGQALATMIPATRATDPAPWAAYAGEIKVVVIVTGVTSVGDNAFAGMTVLVTVTLPETIENIGDGAFGGCSVLVEINIPAGTGIGEGAFDGCDKLPEGKVPVENTFTVGDRTAVMLPAESFMEWYGHDTNPAAEEMIVRLVSADGLSACLSVTLPDGEQWLAAGTYTYHTGDAAAAPANRLLGGRESFVYDNTADAMVGYFSAGSLTVSVSGTGDAAVYTIKVDCTFEGTKGKFAGTYRGTLAWYDESQPQAVAVTGVSLDKTSASLITGGTVHLKATVAPDDAADKSVTWKSSNPAVAAVSVNTNFANSADFGHVTALAPGTATITATSVADPTKTASCTVTVSAAGALTGVKFGSLVWTTRNIGAASESDYGGYYSVEAGQTACPAGWRLPTHTEFMSMAESNSHEWIAVGGVNGRRFSNGSGGSVFFPAGGSFYPATGFDYVGSRGNYWAQTDLVEFGVGMDYLYGVSDGGTGFGWNGMQTGFVQQMNNVRCVQDAPAKSVNLTGPQTGTGTLTAGTAGSVTWGLKTTGIADGTYPATFEWYDGSISTGVSGTATISGGTGTLTVTTTAATPKGGDYFYFTIDGTRSFGFCHLIVNAASSTTVPVTGVTFDKTTLTLAVGEEATLTSTVVPANATDKTVVWSFSDNAILDYVQGDGKGSVKALKVGTTTITATTFDGGKTATCVVTVTAPTVTEPESVIIAGVEWATRNVSTSGKFAANSWDLGGLFNFTTARTVCPAGWHTPTLAENRSLVASGHVRTTSNGVNGFRFGSGANTIFLPAAGIGYANGAGRTQVGLYGDYWSSELAPEYPDNDWAYHLTFDYDQNTVTNDDIPTIKAHVDNPYSVRCVKGAAVTKSVEFDPPQTGIGTLTAGTAGTLTFNLKATGIANGTYPATFEWYNGTISAGVSGSATISGGTGTLTVTTTAATPAGWDFFIITIDRTKSVSHGHLIVNAAQPQVVPVTGVTLNKTQLTMGFGESETLVATVAPANATNKGVTWSTSDKEIASVDANGVVSSSMGLLPVSGVATITATSVADPTKTATCTVTVNGTYTTPDEVTINGVTWATRNLARVGVFAGDQEDFGGYLTLEEAKIGCPAGWKLPSITQFNSLMEAGSVWTTLNDVPGRWYGSWPNRIFMPAAGHRNTNGDMDYQGELGSYRSSNYPQRNISYGQLTIPAWWNYYLGFSSGSSSGYTDAWRVASNHNGNITDFGMSVRCVKN